MINVGTKSQVAAMTNNENGSVKTLAIVDGFYANENQTCQYLYDSDFRLGSADCGSIWKSYYTYDQYGNITKSAGAGPGTTFSPTYNTTTNRYSSIPGGTVTYDGNGNLTNDTFHTYAWDADGNPTTISAKTFLYDAFDRRVDYCSGSSWTQYLYAPSSPGAIVGVGASQTLGLRIQLPGGGQAITNSTAVTDYRRSNWQGSQPIDSSTTQTVLSDAAYTPFGERYQENGYSGYYAGNLSIWSSFMDGYAATNSLYHYDQGRWVSPDPAGLSAVDPTNPQSWNRYAYVLNHPLMNVDPSGLCTYEVTGSYMTPDGPVYVIACPASVDTSVDPGRGGPTLSITDSSMGPGNIGGHGAGGNGSLPQRLASAANFGNNHSIGALFGGGKVAMFLGGNTVSSLANLGLALSNNGPAPQNPGMLALSGPALGVPVNDALRLAGRQTIAQLTSASGFIRGQALQAVFTAATGPSSLTSLAGETALQGGLTASEWASGIAVAKFAYDGATFLYGYFGACR